MNCNYCEFRCDLSKGKGVCGRYILSNGEVCEKEPMHFLPAMQYRIEEMPFFHAYPGTVSSQMGTVSCNAACNYCMNSHVSIEKDAIELTEYTAEAIVENAIANEAQSIVFGINEVTCFMPSALKVADAAHRAGLKMGCLTNGFQTKECAELLAENMDMINVSLKSMDDAFYQKDLGLPSAQPVMRNIEIFSKKSHVEISTPLAMELSIEKLMEMAHFLADIDKNIPWHLLRLQPGNKCTGFQDESSHMPSIIAAMEEIKTFLPYVYLGNLAGSRWVDTMCPVCGELLVKRLCLGACGSKMQAVYLDGKMCPQCKTELPIIV